MRSIIYSVCGREGIDRLGGISDHSDVKEVGDGT